MEQSEKEPTKAPQSSSSPQEELLSCGTQQLIWVQDPDVLCHVVMHKPPL